MSNHSPLPNESIGPSSPDADRESEGRRPGRSLKGPAQFLSFWVAIALPFVHLPLLAQGLGDPSVTLTFVTLLGINAVALYAGHGYNRE
ncbi:hypothetical protein [Natrarchaeobius oligotrophus]|uniref:Uncharacterized protein n=1 Tax=Natrarchaeobius chitinivorans TaxID=1679083 RepID=A0A3N6NEX3_NATCH|nr:hypothetical protein [Natrarchaeobius chitinivorans]RQG97462.1 hypothetical protein EA472_19055 [Natrarchaeobius chitinivorans]